MEEGEEAKGIKRTKKTHSATYTQMIMMVVDVFMVSILYELHITHKKRTPNKIAVVK